MPTPNELRTFLAEQPQETLSAEYKGWLDLTDTRGRATLAKAAIALANHGGGIIVFGMRSVAENSPLESTPKPAEIGRYNQDQVNQAINKFADPEFHCELAFAIHPVTKIEHAFVSVPGNLTVPVMSSRTCEGVIGARKCYMRKPGPRSEEPTTAEEWRTLLDRCVRAGSDRLLDSIRSIIQGRAGGLPQQADSNRLRSFSEASEARWSSLVNDLPANDPARFPHGFYELGFEIIGGKTLPGLAVLRRAMKETGSIRHTGWGPFIDLSRAEYQSRIVGDAIEAWLGLPAERILGRDPAHCDFWRADASGRLTLMRGYDEDSHSRREPGQWLDITIPVWRVGEAILYVGRLAEHFGEDVSILLRCHYVGLQGRKLTSIDGQRMMFDERRCADNEIRLERQFTRTEARDNLVEVLHGLLSPLYERFAFFELSERLVAEEVDRLIIGRF